MKGVPERVLEPTVLHYHRRPQGGIRCAFANARLGAHIRAAAAPAAAQFDAHSLLEHLFTAAARAHVSPQAVNVLALLADLWESNAAMAASIPVPSKNNMRLLKIVWPLRELVQLDRDLTRHNVFASSAASDGECSGQT